MVTRHLIFSCSSKTGLHDRVECRVVMPFCKCATNAVRGMVCVDAKVDIILLVCYLSHNRTNRVCFLINRKEGAMMGGATIIIVTESAIYIIRLAE